MVNGLMVDMVNLLDTHSSRRAPVRS